MEKGKKKKVALPGYEPRTLCMAGQNANHYTRTDYTNYKELLSSITISEQIFEAKFVKLLLLTKKMQFNRNLPNVPKN